MIFLRPSIDPQTAYVPTLLSREASPGASHAPSNLVVGEFGISERVKRILLDEQLDAVRELLTDVEATRPLTVVPVEAILIWPVARSGGWARLARGFATPYVLLAADDPTSMVAQIGTACLAQRHAKSLHKTHWFEGKRSGEVGW